MASTQQNGSQGFPITISEQDLQTPGVPRLNRSLTYIWTYLKSNQSTSSSSSTGTTSQYSTIDPRRYGAKADGSDDSQFISKAIAAGGLYLQSGLVYGFTWNSISAAIAAISNPGWLCSGGGTLKLLSGSTSALTLTGNLSRKFDTVVIDGNGKCGSNPVVYMNTGSLVTMSNVIIKGGTSGQYAINLNGMTKVIFIGVDVSAESPDGLTTSGGASWNAFSCNGIADKIGGW